METKDRDRDKRNIRMNVSKQVKNSMVSVNPF